MRISDWSSDVCSSDLRLESHGWEVVPLDAVRVEEYVTADKGRRTREIDYQLVQQADQAAELAAYDIVNAREFGPVTLPLKTRWMGYRPGDCLTLDIPELGLSSQAANNTRRSIDPATGVGKQTGRGAGKEKGGQEG